MPDGRGILISPDNFMFIGHFKQGRSEGSGMGIYSNGIVSVGTFRNTKKHGNFTLHFPTGEFVTATYVDNDLVKNSNDFRIWAKPKTCFCSDYNWSRK